MTRLVNTNQYGRNAESVIHTDRKCMFVDGDSIPVEEAPVDGAELRECLWCSGNVDRIQEQGKACPFCGDTVNDLPDHLPCEESP